MIKILVIDDNKSFNEILCDWLNIKGYQVYSASDGKQGLMLFESLTPELVITDILMPEFDGVEFLFAINENPNRNKCKIIAISGGGLISGDVYLNSAKSLDVDGVLSKPFEFDRLAKLLDELL